MLERLREIYDWITDGANFMNPDVSAEDIEIIHDFIEESSDMIEQLEPIIIELGQIPKDRDDWPETINAIFRLFHSMKGSAGFLEFGHIQGVAHSAENLLDLVRSGKIELLPSHVDLLCRSCDFAKAALDHVGREYSDLGMEQEAVVITRALKSAIDPDYNDEGRSENTLQKDGSSGEPKTEREEIVITPEMQQAFTREADELLESIEHTFLRWSECMNDAATLSELFRNIHSLKGNSGFLGYADIETLTHSMETVLAGVKDGDDLVGDKPEEIFLTLVDVLREQVGQIAGGGSDTIEGLADYVANLQLVTRRKLGELLLQNGSITQRQLTQALESQEQKRTSGQVVKEIGQELVEMGAVSSAQVETGLQQQKEVNARTMQPVASDKVRRTEQSGPVKALKRQDIRVDLDKLDSLINLIGEMVIAENMLIHNPDLLGLELENFNKAAQQMSKLVRELQEMAMQIRMIPVSGLFRRMIRLVHDLSSKSGKKVELELIGEDTELDKTVIETITDPLVHILRNSLDHGLEPPEERVAAGKQDKGKLILSARHEEGEVWVTIEDDGRGLSRERILAKAMSNGLIEDDGHDLTDEKVFNLIFQAGFSTAEKVTDISGRGVGMDVVKQNLAKIRGKVDVHSIYGSGTRIDLRIPLTLAIIDGMLVRVGRSKCIVPILAIKESFCPGPEHITITPSKDELIRVRESFYPALRLHTVLCKEPDSTRLEDGVLIVLENHGKNVCLLVDEILGQQQTVIKGLSDYIGNPHGISGCTILGDGEVCLILDVGGLIDLAGARHEAQEVIK
jgi:two-component system chemotaxis sensor kinase CheA